MNRRTIVLASVLFAICPVTTTAAVPEVWLDAATEEIRRSEYRFSVTDDSEPAAPNRAHDLRSRFTDEELVLTSRTKGADPGTGGWTLTLRLARFGRGADLDAASPALPVIDSTNAHSVEYRRGDLLEWYVNDERGLEQGFTISRRPEGDAGAEVVLDLATGGNVQAHPTEDGQAIDFHARGGARAMRYSKLVVIDATGRELPARMSVEPGTIRIAYEDDDAAYPVVVDPLMTSASWSDRSLQAGANFGFDVATAGDVNGDGFSDLIIGVPGYDLGPLSADQGRAYVYHGSLSGLPVTADWFNSGSSQDSAFFSYSVSAAGDVNGDGYGDIIVGAYREDGTLANTGAAYVYHGSPTGLSSTPDWRADGDVADAELGHDVAWAGDVNGDGYDDVIVGAHQYENGEALEGMAFLWFGGAGGLGIDGLPGNAGWTAESDQIGAALGHSVACAGDVNGDGYDDVIVGARRMDNGEVDEGAALLWNGGPSGPTATGSPLNADWIAESNQTFALLGSSVSTAGDINGDGYADVLIGASLYDNPETNEGALFVWLGSDDGLGANGMPSNADWFAESDQAGASLGEAAAPAGDIDGDGYADIAGGAPAYDDGLADEGMAMVWFGDGLGLGPAGQPSNADWRGTGGQLAAKYGSAVATAGDVDGDGFSDVVVGAKDHDNGAADGGKAWVYRGAPMGLAADPLWSGAGGQILARYGFELASAGDINGDGYGDIIVGAYQYDDGQTDEGAAFVYYGSAARPGVPDWTATSEQAGALLGISVASAGDVNGDGYGDVLVGASQYDNGEIDEGAAFIWLGSATGLVPSGTPANADWMAEGDQASAQLGRSVASAGDVNGDGFGDVILGVHLWDKGTPDVGGARVHLGSASGPDLTAVWSASGNQQDSRFGLAISSAGDVNGDGFSDLLIGAQLYDAPELDEGRAYLYHGSASGPSSSPAWTAESNQAGALFGSSGAAAGDVNGDGYGDVIIGSPWYDNPESQEGSAFLWLGGPSGLGANGEPTNADWSAESDMNLALLGSDVASAGDVNGDGYSDVIVGAPRYSVPEIDEGAVFLWHGSASGLGVGGTTANADWSYESNEIGAELGRSVASAGDMNGDGFGDVIVGSDLLDFNFTDEGMAFVFMGNEGSLMVRRPLQTRVDQSAPVYLLGVSDDDYSFRLSASGRSAAGRTRVRLEWELEPFGTAFDGRGLGQGASDADTGVPSGLTGSSVDVSELVAGLTSATRYHWRVRAKSRSPLFPSSPWVALAYNGWEEADILTGGFPDVDGDGIQNDLDCNDGDNSVWSIPSEVPALFFSSDKQTMAWSEPLDPGGLVSAMVYDTLSAKNSSDFSSQTICVESDDGSDRRAVDMSIPNSGESYFYLTRPENACGSGTLGFDSSGTERSGIACP